MHPQRCPAYGVQSSAMLLPLPNCFQNFEWWNLSRLLYGQKSWTLCFAAICSGRLWTPRFYWRKVLLQLVWVIFIRMTFSKKNDSKPVRKDFSHWLYFTLAWLKKLRNKTKEFKMPWVGTRAAHLPSAWEVVGSVPVAVLPRTILLTLIVPHCGRKKDLMVKRNHP